MNICELSAVSKQRKDAKMKLTMTENGNRWSIVSSLADAAAHASRESECEKKIQELILDVINGNVDNGTYEAERDAHENNERINLANRWFTFEDSPSDYTKRKLDVLCVYENGKDRAAETYTDINWKNFLVMFFNKVADRFPKAFDKDVIHNAFKGDRFYALNNSKENMRIADGELVKLDNGWFLETSNNTARKIALMRKMSTIVYRTYNVDLAKYCKWKVR